MGTVKERLGGNVRARRQQIGLSQAQLAEAVGKTDTSIGLLERGKVWPEFESLTAIAETLKCSVDDFFTGMTPTPDASAEDLLAVLKAKNQEIARLKREKGPELTEPQRELLGLIAGLNEPQAASLLRILRRTFEILREDDGGDLSQFELLRKKLSRK